MITLVFLDMVLRLLAIGQLLLIGLIFALGRAPRRLRLAILLLLLSVIAYLLDAAPFLREPATFLRLPALFAAQFPPLLLWLCAHFLFERPLPRRPAAAAAAVVTACAAIFVAAAASGRPAPLWTISLHHLVSLALLVHALAVTWRDRDNDLVERRRRLRIGFVLVIGFQALAVVLVETLHGYSPVAPELILVQSAIAAAATLGFGAYMLTASPDLTLESGRAAAPALFSPSEHVLNGKLEAFMAQGVYRETGLTIGGLAGRLDVPEHKLRSLINRRLGYRNFSDFLNRHRIAEAKTLLADPERVDLPVLTIAMDLGYGSLTPFNRAFRETTAQTPSEFRRMAILGK